ncbi:MAG: hypothetical protein KAR40_01890 [Candidatus Sabulitectum sp.]|nr:hypothetical protein [Candidatus Sabulitectum sp.]
MQAGDFTATEPGGCFEVVEPFTAEILKSPSGSLKGGAFIFIKSQVLLLYGMYSPLSRWWRKHCKNIV